MASQKIALLLVCRVFVSDFPWRNLPAYKKNNTLTQNGCGWDYSSLIYQAQDRNYFPEGLPEESSSCQGFAERASTPLKVIG